jgi:DNA repair exonuclease SbcCD ATPase subunit
MNNAIVAEIDEYSRLIQSEVSSTVTRDALLFLMARERERNLDTHNAFVAADFAEIERKFLPNNVVDFERGDGMREVLLKELRHKLSERTNAFNELSKQLAEDRQERDNATKSASIYRREAIQHKEERNELQKQVEQLTNQLNTARENFRNYRKRLYEAQDAHAKAIEERDTALKAVKGALDAGPSSRLLVRRLRKALDNG